MIMIYGPAGSGKSTQGKILAEKLQRQWLSAGQMIRDSGRFEEFTRSGKMIDERMLVELIAENVGAAESKGKKVVFDGQPGTVEQVVMLEEVGLLKKVEGVILLMVPEEELKKRLAERGREDDNEEVWEERFRYFEQKIYTFLTEMEKKGVRVERVNGVGEIEEVSARIMVAVDKF